MDQGGPNFLSVASRGFSYGVGLLIQVFSRWCFQIFFIFIPTWGFMIQFDGSHIFQMGGEKPPASFLQPTHG